MKCSVEFPHIPAIRKPWLFQTRPRWPANARFPATWGTLSVPWVGQPRALETRSSIEELRHSVTAAPPSSEQSRDAD